MQVRAYVHKYGRDPDRKQQMHKEQRRAAERAAKAAELKKVAKAKQGAHEADDAEVSSVKDGAAGQARSRSQASGIEC